MLNRVMLIEDDDVTLMICKLRLKKSMFCNEVITTENGAEAIKYFEDQLLLKEEIRKIPELILLDLNMPVMDGWEFLNEFEQKYQAIFNSVRIAVLSSSLDPDDEERTKNHPLIIGFISKPLTEENLLELKNSVPFRDFYK
jgi:CheY-like chemotaxis protein